MHAIVLGLTLFGGMVLGWMACHLEHPDRWKCDEADTDVGYAACIMYEDDRLMNGMQEMFYGKQDK